MRPDNLDLGLPGALDTDLERWWRPAIRLALAERLWDVAAWSDERKPFCGARLRLVPDGPDALAPGFELWAAVLRHLQADPLLPAALAPEGWPGDRLRTTYDRWDTQYRATLSEWSRDA